MPIPRKIVLINREPEKLTVYERGALDACFPGEPLQYIRRDIPDTSTQLPNWSAHIEYCKKHLTPNRDVILIPSTTTREEWAGLVLLATKANFTHLFFGRDIEVRKLIDVKIESIPYRQN